jgi:nucleoside phosphorylase
MQQISNIGTVVILTALPLEYRAVRAHLSDIREDTHPQKTIYERGVFKINEDRYCSVALAEIGTGNSSAAAEAERAIQFFSADYIFFVGVAGGIKDVSLGDVIAATKVYGYESGVARSSFQTRPDVGQTSYDLEQRARAVARTSDWQRRIIGGITIGSPKAFVAPIAAGEKVIKSKKSEIFLFIKEHYGDALGVEMEGRGLLSAMRLNQISGMVIRGISDLIEGKSEADASGSQEIAAANAAAFAFEMLYKLGAQKNTNAQPGDSLFQRIQNISTSLYPIGPVQRELWARAGGDISRLRLSEDGRTTWFSALELIQNGGGGSAISLKTLVSKMTEDFPNNTDLAEIYEILA